MGGVRCIESLKAAHTTGATSDVPKLYVACLEQSYLCLKQPDLTLSMSPLPLSSQRHRRERAETDRLRLGKRMCLLIGPSHCMQHTYRTALRVFLL